MKSRTTVRAALISLMAFGIAAGCGHLAPNHPDPKPFYLWCDATANLERIGSTEGLTAVLDRCAEAGITAVIIDVRPISGHVLFPSALAPRLERWPLHGDPQRMWERDPDFDLLAEACRLGHARGLEVFAALNVFSAGHKTVQVEDGRMRGPVFDTDPDWAAWDLIQLEGESHPRLRPTTKHARSYAAFTSPHSPEVRTHALSLIRELVESYPIDGVVLDRVRYDGLFGDFSPWARAAFEERLGHPIDRWPEDVCTRTGTAPDALEPGPLWDAWLLFRAQTIHDFITEAREHVKDADPSCVFANYVGAWYPTYWEVGVNWADPDFEPRWPGFAPGWARTGYADELDLIFAGTYFYAVTPDEIPPHPRGRSGDWLSVSGSAALAREVLDGNCPLIGSLYVEQYLQGSPTGELNAEQFARAMRAAHAGTDGLMIFDLVHLDTLDAWDVVAEFLREASSQPTPAPLSPSER